MKKLVIGFFGFVAFATVITSGLIGYGKVKSANTTTTPAPQFNFMQGDSEMLRGSKYVTGSTFTDPVPNINVGDEVQVALYIHNGVLNSTAHNTTVRVDLTGTPSSSITMKSHLWSDETTDINDTIVNGQIVGKSGLTINMANSVLGRAEYIAGTTQVYKSVQNGDGSYSFVYDKDMIDGITQNVGLNLGDVNGCWNYAKLVIFRVKIRGTTSFIMDKTVRESGTTAWLQNTTAMAGDTMEYRVAIQNTGTEPATVVLKDIKPPYMTYINGSTYYADYLHPAPGVQQPDTLFTASGITITNVPVDIASTTTVNEGIVYLIYKLKIDSVLPISDSNGTCVAGYSLNNLAELYLNGTQIWTDTANVTATCPATKSLTILKQVQTSTGTWAKSNTAILGNTLTYQLTIKNTGNSTISNVTARDIVPQYTNYIVGSTKLNGTVANDQIITTTGLNLGSLNASQQDIVTLQVKLYGCIPIGGYTLTNTGYAWADTVTQISDSATTSVNVMAPSI